jgi:hypothetical protein
MQLYSFNYDTFRVVQSNFGSKFPADGFHVSFLKLITNIFKVNMINVNMIDDIQFIVVELMSYLQSYSTYICVASILKIIVFVSNNYLYFFLLMLLNNYVTLTVCLTLIYALPMH